MATVPYDPVPDAASAGPSGRLGDAPVVPDAFGINIAEAVKGFGSTLEKSGEELANRALAIQHDKNIADADAADTEFMKQAGIEHARYNALEGKERADGFEAHVEKLEQIRANVRKMVTNVDAQNMYDRQSRNTLGRTIFNAAGASASGQRQYEKETAISNLGMSTQDYANNPSPTTLAKIEQKAREVSGMTTGGGMYDANAENAARKAVSNALLKRIELVARNDGPGAERLRNQNESRLTPDDKVTANNIVTAQATNQYAERIGNEIQERSKETPTNAEWSLNEKEAEARRMVKELDPQGKLPFLEKSAIAAVQQKDAIKYKADRRDSAERINDLVGLTQETNASTPFELFQNPKAYDIYNRMDPRTRDIAVTKIIKAYQDRLNRDDGGENYKTLRGMAQNNTELFMQTNPGDWKVGPGDWKSLMTIRDKILRGNGQYNDPRVGRAMTWLKDKYGQTLDNAQVIGRNKDEKMENLFHGTLAVAIDQWQQDHPGKPLTAKDVQEDIWGQLRGETKEERSFKDVFGSGFNLPYGPDKVVPNWKMQVSKDPQLREQLKQEILKRRTTTYEPSEDELRNEYMRTVWKQFSPTFKKPE